MEEENVLQLINNSENLSIINDSDSENDPLIHTQVNH